MSSIEIKAPVEKVFSYTVDLDHLTEWNPRARSVSNLSGSGLGLTHEWTAQYKGREVKGQSIWTDFVPNQKVTIMLSPVNQCWNWIYSPAGEGKTRLIFTMNGFTVERRSSDGVVRMFTTSEQQEFMDGVLKNIKTGIESESR